MKTMKAAIILMVLGTLPAGAQILLSSGTAYQLNFDKLAAPPLDHDASVDNETMPGWYAARELGTYAPGFPKDGKWVVKWEGLKRMR